MEVCNGNGSSFSVNAGSDNSISNGACLHKFRLYETRSNFYMIGRDKSRTYWRVLKIDRLDPSELNVREDSATYTEHECSDLLKRIHDGNIATGGLKFVTTCYGILGFIKFLGPYYMLLITKRREIGAICGHTVYAISKSEMIPLPSSIVRSNLPNSGDENRYKRLLCMVDLTKDFFFSYSYHVMRSLQKNLCNDEAGLVLYESMFVWNEFLTREVRNHLQNTLWTVALVYGFFEQTTLSVDGRGITLTLIARRSRHYAGTRYLKRGVNEKGKVANDVETEQIVYEDVPEGFPMQITSVVQNRGSIPLFWSQETSRLNLKPDIILSKKDQTYEATRIHFENLVDRYGNPIIILNLIKTEEKKPRESILRAEFANAIDFINKDFPEENRLRFLHWDLHKHSRSEATNALLFLGKVAAYALTLTGFFYYLVSPTFRSDGCRNWSPSENVEDVSSAPCNGVSEIEVCDSLERKSSVGDIIVDENHSRKGPLLQKGVLRTNCIDCLDRTNVAQYAYGLAALGHQLHALGVAEYPKMDFDSSLADELMGLYERMGDTLAHQYGGSAAHNKVSTGELRSSIVPLNVVLEKEDFGKACIRFKQDSLSDYVDDRKQNGFVLTKIFSERRGHWKAAIQSQEFFRTLQRYYNNAYMDNMKQDAIDLFLGNFLAEKDKPALWELDSYHHYDSDRNGETDDEDTTSIFKRCMSDGNILQESSSSISETKVHGKLSGSAFPDRSQVGTKVLCDSSPNISTTEIETTFSRYTPSVPRRQLFGDVSGESNYICYSEYCNASNYSNFVDLDWLSSSGNSCEDEQYDRSSVLTSSPVTGLSSENVVVIGATPSTSDSSMKGREHAVAELSSHASQGSDMLEDYTDSFTHWVNHGEAICH